MFLNRRGSSLAIAYDISCSKQLLTTAYTSHRLISAGNMRVIIPIQAKWLHLLRNVLPIFRPYYSLVSMKRDAALSRAIATDLLSRSSYGKGEGDAYG